MQCTLIRICITMFMLMLKIGEVNDISPAKRCEVVSMAGSPDSNVIDTSSCNKSKAQTTKKQIPLCEKVYIHLIIYLNHL